MYNKKSVKDSTKASVFSALVLSWHVDNVHTWAWATQSDFEQWENGIRPQAAVACCQQGKPIAPFQFTTVSINGPGDVLHANRLRYVKRAIITAPAALWSLLPANANSNLRMPRLLESCQWLSDHAPGGFGIKFDNVADALQFTAVDLKWNGRIRSASRSCLLEKHMQRENCGLSACKGR